MRKLRIEVVNRQDSVACNTRAIRRTLQGVLAEAVESAELSVAVVGDEEITRLNRRYLGRDRPTDVIAFPYESRLGHLEGEVVINADEALRQAERVTHGPQEELLLYAVHGVLHLLGHDDAAPEQRKHMHERELALLASAGHVLDSKTLLEE